MSISFLPRVNLVVQEQIFFFFFCQTQGISFTYATPSDIQQNEQRTLSLAYNFWTYHNSQLHLPQGVWNFASRGTLSNGKEEFIPAQVMDNDFKFIDLTINIIKKQ